MLQKTIEAQDEQTPLKRYTGTENILLTDEQRKEADEIFEEAFRKIFKGSPLKRPKWKGIQRNLNSI